MNRYLLIAITIILLVYESHSQWEYQNSTVGATLWDICFVDSLYGWAVGDSGTIVSTSDGGTTWTRIMGPIGNVEINRVQFLDRQTGFVAGNTIRTDPGYEVRSVKALQTTDGGLTWERRDSLFDPDLRFGDFQFLDISHGLIGSNNFTNGKGLLFKTGDGGRNWSVLQENDSLFIGTVAFFDSSLGYTFWSPGVDNFDDTEVYRTEGGGSGWVHAGTISMEMGVGRAKIICAGTIWAIGISTSCSVDSGRTWQSWNWFTSVLEGQKRFVARDIEVLDADNVWLAGNAFTSASDMEGMLLRTSNAGQTWWPDLELPDEGFQALGVVSGRAWIAGKGGLILHLNNLVSGVGTQVWTHPDLTSLDQNYPNPFNPSTTIRYSLPVRSRVVLSVFNVLGQKVATLQDGEMDAGIHEVSFDARALSSGVYFYRISVGVYSEIKQMMVVR